MPRNAEAPAKGTTADDFAPTQWNIIYLLMTVGALMAALSISIQPLLLDKIFGIAFEKEGAVNADIQVVAEIVSIVCVGWFGLLSDRIGRVRIIALGFLIAVVGAAVSLLSLQVGLAFGAAGLVLFYLTRVLLTVGADTVQLQLSTLVGDVSSRANRPRLMGNLVFMMVFGGTMLAAIVMQMADYPGGVFLIMCLPLLAGIAGFQLTRRNLRDVAPPQPASEDDEHPLRQVWTVITSDPRMQLAFAAAFYTRADVIILSLFFSLWCISVSDLVGVTRTFATAHAAVMIGLLGLAVLAAVPLWRSFIERHSRISAIGASLSLAALGYIWLGMFANPFNWLVALPLLMVGIGHAGCFVTLQVLTVDASPKPILGAMVGAGYLVGGLGTVMLVQSGGYYFDALGPRAPFILMGTGKMLVTLYAAWLLANGIDETCDHHLKSARTVDWKPLVFLTAALPFVWLVGRSVIEGYISNGSLGEAPVGFVNRYLGDWAFTFLIISLAMRPVQEITGIKTLAKYRRMIGLFAFFYAVMHVLAYVALEWALNLGDMMGDIYKRPFILLGLVAFALLIPLAFTSANSQIKRIGGKRWKKLHSATYVINALVALHFILAANHENGEPYVYAAAVIVLLWYRFHQWRGGNVLRALRIG
ncbi:MFS transporter permease [Magnetospirillum sp. ME-1]|uniref:Magnetosome protein MamZ n=2 Tax=Paramagnetospirillum TaxID=3031148 RepID=MAMZ_PARM1|nr:MULTISPECIES: magnetosome biogenesis transporter MamZ [Rhodospirillales]Q2W8K5.1 RecName: Full=Magnetosome protein MamZ; AltName: Full=Probable magnetosome permease MamZ [Paramagnetospirillum magneticum AMB-1]ARJ64510.1 MFS transporter permease [Magnetospirillum sp. ME-1]EME71127.1 major facilitator superfamily permease [Paramagnetospirillum caucaseum]BAE49820.1 Permease of the major facilitator superfamily [Paramagnetospirillum magneticum AMB-1]